MSHHVTASAHREGAGLDSALHHDEEEHHTVHKYGKLQIKELDIPRKTHFFGLIRPPTSRINWVDDPNTGEPVLVREKEERKTTWTELFYDLIFVVVINKLAHALAEEPEYFERYVVLFLAVWRIWSNTVFYATRYDTNDLIHKVFYYILMLGLLGMGINMAPTFHKGYSEEFAVCYLVAKSVLIILNFMTTFFNDAQGIALPYGVSLTVTSIPWIVSLFLDKKHSMTCWWVGVIADEVITVAVPPIIRKMKRFRTPVYIEHLIERFGLFVIIVLGENIVGSLFSDEKGGYSAAVYGASALGIWTTFCMQWIYFDAEGAPKRKHALRRNIFKAIGWGYIHTFLIASLVVAAAGASGTLKACGKSLDLGTGSRWMEAAGLGAANFSMSLIWLASKEQHHRVNRYFIFSARVAASILLILVPLFTEGLHPVKFNALCAGIVTFIAIATLMGTIVSQDPKSNGAGISMAIGRIVGRKQIHHH